MNENTSLSNGFYVGVRSNIRNFHFDPPKMAKGITDDVSMEEFFRSLNGGGKVRTTAPTSGTESGSTSNEATTLFSGWFSTTKARNLSDKCRQAALIYAAASEDGVDEPTMCANMVRSFKKGAAAVLGRCADSGEAITQATADEINRNACVLTEIKVIVLCVSDTEVSGGRLDPKTGKWYSEKVIRKFYVSHRPLKKLLEAFAQELADDTTNVTMEGKLVAVRSDKVTVRQGRNYRESQFRIVTSYDTGSAEDERIKLALDRIRARYMRT